jgi:hypothetical protein
MSLLHQNQSEETDDAARGEEFTRGTSHIVWASIVAAVLVSIAIGAVLWSGQKPPVAVGEVDQVRAHIRHVETSGMDANGAPMAKDIYDEVLVFAHVRLRNQSQQPLFLHEIMCNTTLDDGIHSSYAASPVNYERLFKAYPELATLHGKPQPAEVTLEPGQSQEGEIVTAFRLTKQQWEAHKDLNFSFAFQYQPKLVLVPKNALIEQ